ncbi:SDR family NAD(P)-dependent oxidoreductase [Marinobacter sp. AL4B]|uniref:SDR family NAD(P)-dependent oxidoreductase n=1 Tax=Marinobacter sp. AL4B TaxID=2871173 RepID=UPI001CAA482A|nr:SDR family oxidoreductase [Marinobacter sp. AL4B]MBZ0333458.1 SDR family oxidoreductase [Marinobacter sp. AL4B]
MSQYARYPSLKGRHIFISGGASGIGACMVEHFCEQQSKVTFVDIDEKAGTALAERMQAQGAQVRFSYCNVTDIASLRQVINAAVDDFGTIEVLVNNAARDTRVPLTELDVETWDELQATNLRHVLFASQAVFAGMEAAGGGSIINFSSPSFMRRSRDISAYSSAKAGTIGLTRTLSRDMGDAGIRVNTVLPGWVITERQKALWWDPELERQVLENQSLHQRVVPADVARMVLFLASDDSRMITAQTYIVDGGLV